MKNRFNIIMLSLLIGSLTLHGAAFAHGTEMHGKMAADDAQMKKLHAIMPMFTVSSAKMEAALEKGDAVTVDAEAGKILAALPDLKKSKPHKNIKQRNKFVVMATRLERAVTSTADLAKKGDFAGARNNFRKVEQACAACHATFRD